MYLPWDHSLNSHPSRSLLVFYGRLIPFLQRVHTGEGCHAHQWGILTGFVDRMGLATFSTGMWRTTPTQEVVKYIKEERKKRSSHSQASSVSSSQPFSSWRRMYSSTAARAFTSTSLCSFQRRCFSSTFSRWSIYSSSRRKNSSISSRRL